jgi:hypothetical protein
MFDAIIRSRPLWPGEESIGPYAERSEPERSKLDGFIARVYAALSSRLRRDGSAKLIGMADAVDALVGDFTGLADEELRGIAGRMRIELTRRGRATPARCCRISASTETGSKRGPAHLTASGRIAAFGRAA